MCLSYPLVSLNIFYSYSYIRHSAILSYKPLTFGHQFQFCLQQVKKSTLSSPDLHTYDSCHDVDLPYPWPSIQQWAVNKHCLAGIARLIDAGNISDDPKLITTFIREVSSSSALDILEQWSENHNEHLSEILSVGHAALHDTSIFEVWPPLLQGASIDPCLRGKLQFRYAIALAAQQYPFSDRPHEQDWYRQLRLWHLLHTIERSARGNSIDSNLRRVANGLRLAGDQKSSWVQLILSIRQPLKFASLTIDDLDHLLIARTQSMLAERTSSSKRAFLRAVIEVAQHADAAENNLLPVVSSQIYPKFFSSSKYNEDIVSSMPLALYQDENLQHVDYHQENEEDPDSTTWTGMAITQHRSYTHQRLDIASTLLASAFERQSIPWAWSMPNPHEVLHLKQWTEQLINDEAPHLQLLGALLWIGLHTGRSLRLTLEIELLETSDWEWRIHPDCNLLHRLPPKRISHSKLVQQYDADWVIPVAASVKINIPDRIMTTLKQSIKTKQITVNSLCLGDLWYHPDGITPIQCFEQYKPVRRLTAGMVGKVLDLETFQALQDSQYTRLICSHPRTGLPGSCAYPSWSVEQIESMLNRDQKSEYSILSDPHFLGMGSRLSVIEQLLQAQIKQTNQRLINTVRDGHLIDIHNQLSGYLALSIWAATGMRAVHDPLETSAQIDQEQRLLFINDKSSGGARNGRLVPLPAQLCVFLTEDYPKYLHSLSRVLPTDCHSMAATIHDLAKCQRPVDMPFLFILQIRNGLLEWRSISESNVDALNLFSCPLPLRLFRHRLLNNLRSQEISAEIIDGLAGHAEGGTASYGPYSTRCWHDDIVLARPAIEAAFATLGFINEWPVIKLPKLPASHLSSDPASNRFFGTQARTIKRKRMLRRNREQACKIISEHTRVKPLEDLDEQALNALVKGLLFYPNGLPKTSGFIQYTVFIKHIERVWHKSGKKVAIPRRYVPISPDDSPFTIESVGTTTWYQSSSKRFERYLKIQATSRLRLNRLITLGVLSLCILDRVTNLKLLHAVISGHHYRIIRYRDHDYLDYSERWNYNTHPIPNSQNDTPWVDVPSMRFPICAGTAKLLDRALSSKKRRIQPDKPLSPALSSELNWLLPKTENHQLPFSVLLEELVQHVNQYNQMDLPGILAGYLSGKVLSAALGWADWVRLQSGKHLHISAQGVEPKNDSDHLIGASSNIEIDSQQMLKTAYSFCREYEQLFNEFETKTRQNLRRQLKRKLNHILNEHQLGLSSAMSLLGRWTVWLIDDPVKGSRGKTPKLKKISTVRRYFDALSPRFREVAYEFDLLRADADEITELYETILLVRSSVNPGYVANRLIDFHHWASQLQVAEPDWPNLPLVNCNWSVSPGYIRESDYQKTLLQLVRETGYNAAFILFLCYRFGLRGKEAIGLRRQDWIMEDEQHIINVTNNAFRNVKTANSKRQLPLLFPLSQFEQEIIDYIVANSFASHGDDQLAPIIGQSGEARRLPNTRQIDAINAALKSVTGNQQITLHHARHSLGNRLAQLLFGSDLKSWKKENGMTASSGIQQYLLNSEGTTRRAPWALAVYMGHASPVTSLRNYLHFIPEWLSETFKHVRNGRRGRANTIDLNKCPKISVGITNFSTKIRITATDIVKMLRLVANGSDMERVAGTFNIPDIVVSHLKTSLRHIDVRVRLFKDVKDSNHDLINRITENGWHRLIKLSDKLDKDTDRKLTICIQGFTKTIGGTGQIVLYEEASFQLMKSIVERLDIPESIYQVVYNSNRSMEDAMEHGFKPISIEEASGKSRFRIDRIEFDVNQKGSKGAAVDRCGFVLKRNSLSDLRNRHELIILLICFISSIEAEQNVTTMPDLPVLN